MREKILKKREQIVSIVSKYEKFIKNKKLNYMDVDNDRERFFLDNYNNLYYSRILIGNNHNCTLVVDEVGDNFLGKGINIIRFYNTEMYQLSYSDFYYDYGFINIASIWTDQKFQGRGIAGLALAHVIDFSKKYYSNDKFVLYANSLIGIEEGEDLSFLEVDKNLNNLLEFYGKFGFKEVGNKFEDEYFVRRMEYFNEMNISDIEKIRIVDEFEPYINKSSRKSNIEYIM